MFITEIDIRQTFLLSIWSLDYYLLLLLISLTLILLVFPKGDGNIRYYEITDSPPYCHFLSQYISGEPQVSPFLPKSGYSMSLNLRLHSFFYFFIYT